MPDRKQHAFRRRGAQVKFGPEKTQPDLTIFHGMRILKHHEHKAKGANTGGQHRGPTQGQHRGKQKSNTRPTQWCVIIVIKTVHFIYIMVCGE